MVVFALQISSSHGSSSPLMVVFALQISSPIVLMLCVFMSVCALWQVLMDTW